MESAFPYLPQSKETEAGLAPLFGHQDHTKEILIKKSLSCCSVHTWSHILWHIYKHAAAIVRSVLHSSPQQGKEELQ